MQMLRAASSPADAGRFSQEFREQSTHISPVCQVMPMATVMAKNDIIRAKFSENADGIGFLSKAGMGGTFEYSPRKIIQYPRFEQPNSV